MSRVRSKPGYGLRDLTFGVAAVGAAIIVSSNSADARYYHHYARHAVAAPHAGTSHHLHAEGYSPPTSSVVVDGNTGDVLHASNADATRHPASLTKIMTLYLLFERLDAGKIKLDTALKVSEHAADQAPTKLGLKPGQTIAVEDAIKAVVTKSANDAAVAIAENLGGDEDAFAKLMTEKAHALGMSRTTYVNASGLPDDDQNTTAQDQALLGRAIQERFPRYYKYFSTEEFVYRGHAMRNHNHLLGVVGGVDGIKTGYTHASGFNLVTSVHRDGRYIIAVVLGGRSAYERDARMRDLINAHIREASLQRTAPAIAEKAEHRGEQKPVTFSKAPLSGRADPAPTASAKGGGSGTVGTSDPIQPLLVRTITYRTAPLQTAPLVPMPALVPAAAQVPQLAAAAAGRPPQASPLPEAPNTVVVASADPAAIATTAKAEALKSEPPKSEAAKPDVAKPEVAKPEAAKPEAAKPEAAKSEVAKSEAAIPEPTKPAAAKPEALRIDIAKPEPTPTQIRARGGWLIQIGAYEAEDEARQHLSEAKLKIPSMLAAADPFTERVQKGDKALYRARFAGFDKAMAEAACKQLKRSDFACMTVKN
jgi:D-alanyl-D-alanine carboxypeptidase